MSGSGPGGPLRDELAPRPVSETETVFTGRVWDVVRERVDLGDGGEVVRDYQRHPGAVGVLALDEQDRVLMIRQYRHPVGHLLWELPAGLLDVAGEPPATAAARELGEEADLRAGTWHVLLDWFNSPGGSDEAFRLFLARGLSAVPEAERHVRDAEELDIEVRWVPLDEARDAVLAGDLHNPSAVTGVLAAWAARASGWASLRPFDAPWPQHRAYR